MPMQSQYYISLISAWFYSFTECFAFQPKEYTRVLKNPSSVGSTD